MNDSDDTLQLRRVRFDSSSPDDCFAVYAFMCRAPSPAGLLQALATGNWAGLPSTTKDDLCLDWQPSTISRLGPQDPQDKWVVAKELKLDTEVDTKQASYRLLQQCLQLVEMEMVSLPAAYKEKLRRCSCNGLQLAERLLHEDAAETARAAGTASGGITGFNAGYNQMYYRGCAAGHSDGYASCFQEGRMAGKVAGLHLGFMESQGVKFVVTP